MATAPDPRKFAATERAENARNMRYIIAIDDDEYVFRFGDLSARDVRDLREQTGLFVRDVLDGLDGVAQLDRMAAMVWLARRQAGDMVSFEDVESKLRLDQAISIREETSPEPAEENPDPPPFGGS